MMAIIYTIAIEIIKFHANSQWVTDITSMISWNMYSYVVME